jgi:DNA-binding NarL/FixJ family response regulator
VAAQTIAACAARLGSTAAIRTAVTAADAVNQLAAAPADVVLADTALSRPDSGEFTRRVLTASPGAALVLFGPEEPRAATAAIAAGARGVIRDASDPVTLVTKALMLLLAQPGPAQREPVESAQAVRTTALAAATPAARATAARVAAVPQQAAAVPHQRADGVVEPPRRRIDLTERELQVLRGMADGKSNAEIGRELYVSEDTVKTHARRLFRKLGARDRAHAVASAFRAGLVS